MKRKKRKSKEKGTVHAHSFLPIEVVNELKEKTGESSLNEALKVAISHYIDCSHVKKIKCHKFRSWTRCFMNEILRSREEFETFLENYKKCENFYQLKQNLHYTLFETICKSENPFRVLKYASKSKSIEIASIILRDLRDYFELVDQRNNLTEKGKKIASYLGIKPKDTG
jgi:hypothetical protein